jgi:hypothetical protein
MGPVRRRPGASQPLRVDRPTASTATASSSTATTSTATTSTAATSTAATSTAATSTTSSTSTTGAASTSTTSTTSARPASTSAAPSAFGPLRRPPGHRVTPRSRETEDPAAALRGRRRAEASLEASGARHSAEPPSTCCQTPRLSGRCGRGTALTERNQRQRSLLATSSLLIQGRRRGTRRPRRFRRAQRP